LADIVTQETLFAASNDVLSLLDLYWLHSERNSPQCTFIQNCSVRVNVRSNLGLRIQVKSNGQGRT